MGTFKKRGICKQSRIKSHNPNTVAITPLILNNQIVAVKNSRINTFLSFCKKHKLKILFLLLLSVFIFFRFYNLEKFTALGWDQADSAWAAKSILYDNPLRTEGVPIKGNTSVFMGPLYYYMVTPIYFLTNMDMIASSIFAGIISIISFVIFFYITKKLFGTFTAAVAAFIFTFSLSVIQPDRVQAAYVLIPVISYAIFYFLYKVITGEEKYILYIAAAVGFGFHAHFTTIMYPFLVLLTLPLFPKTKKTLLYLLLAVPIFLIFMSPILYTTFFAKQSSSGSFQSYFNTFFHGFHLTRMLQINRDAFISFQQIFQLPILQPFTYFLIPIFALVSYYWGPKKYKLLLPFLLTLWILVPWILLTTYSGELTDYYFSAPKYIGIAAIAFILTSLYKRKFIAAKIFVCGLLIIFAGYNMYLFSLTQTGNYLSIRETVKDAIRDKRKMEFRDRDPVFYMYHIKTADLRND